MRSRSAQQRPPGAPTLATEHRSGTDRPPPSRGRLAPAAGNSSNNIIAHPAVEPQRAQGVRVAAKRQILKRPEAGTAAQARKLKALLKAS
jgi:hypothetical protein